MNTVSTMLPLTCVDFLLAWFFLFDHSIIDNIVIHEIDRPQEEEELKGGV